ncbi:unnamed protein product [Linum trigynum]|uniref:Uncharacterized protein n=1 Tax=Linum trigynum TaxID=586398 RepID=A0AAV2CZ62_9ROSI
MDAVTAVPVSQPAQGAAPSGAATRGVGKRLMEQSAPAGTAKRSKVNSPRSKVAEDRGKGVASSVKVTQIDLPP